MRYLTATDVLRIWELGERQSLSGQALTLLAVACPEFNDEQLADLSLGERDRRLFLLHQRLFGTNLNGFVECPQCHQRLEFTWPIPAMDTVDEMDTTGSQLSFSIDGFEVCGRLPNSRDISMAADCSDSTQARQSLLRSCVLEARRDGTSVDAAELPESVVSELADRLAQSHPWQEVLLDIVCSSCGQRWQPLLDIVTFLWTEWSTLARRLLREVHALARAYGWSESEVLAMSVRRRQIYLEMVGA